MKRPEDVAREAIEANLEWYPNDIFGDDLTKEQWQAIRDVSPFSTERIAATCYRHAYRVALETVSKAFAEWREDEADAVARALIAAGVTLNETTTTTTETTDATQ